MKMSKKKVITIIEIIVVVGGSIGGSIAYSIHKQDVYNENFHIKEVAKLNKTASDLAKEITTCDSYSKTSAARHKPSEVSMYITAVADATNASENSNKQNKLDEIIKKLDKADTLFRSEEKTQPAQLLAMAKIATQKKIALEKIVTKNKRDSDNLRINDISQMNGFLNKDDFDGAKSFISESEGLEQDEIDTLGHYIDGKQEYTSEVQDDANHPEYKAPNSSLNYAGVTASLGEINPQYKGIYSNEIKIFSHKFMKDDEWATDYADSVTSDAKAQAQLNAPVPSIGMTSDEVLSSKWGSPDNKNVTTTADGTSEQWVYDSYGYVYLDNGIVTTIQTN